MPTIVTLKPLPLISALRVTVTVKGTLTVTLNVSGQNSWIERIKKDRDFVAVYRSEHYPDKFGS